MAPGDEGLELVEEKFVIGMTVLTQSLGELVDDVEAFAFVEEVGYKIVFEDQFFGKYFYEIFGADAFVEGIAVFGLIVDHDNWTEFNVT